MSLLTQLGDLQLQTPRVNQDKVIVHNCSVYDDEHQDMVLCKIMQTPNASAGTLTAEAADGVNQRLTIWQQANGLD